jgi:hypothetical protein
MNSDTQKTNSDVFGEVIYTYTRKQAIEDGYQVLLTGKHAELAREAGWKYPVYLTRSVWDLMEQSVASKQDGDMTGVLWNILVMARFGDDIANDTRAFKMMISGCYDKKRLREIYLQVGPTDIDDPSPAITIMLEQDR